MKIGSLNIYEDLNGGLVLEKKKSKKYLDLIFYSALPLVMIAPILKSLIDVKFQVKNVGLGIGALVVGLAALVVYLWIHIKSTLINTHKYVLSDKGGTLTINGETFCDSTEVTKVVIQKYSDGNAGVHYNIGVSCQKKLVVLTLFHSLKEAEMIAGTISHFLGAEVINEESRHLYE